MADSFRGIAVIPPVCVENILELVLGPLRIAVAVVVQQLSVLLGVGSGRLAPGVSVRNGLAEISGGASAASVSFAPANTRSAQDCAFSAAILRANAIIGSVVRYRSHQLPPCANTTVPFVRFDSQCADRHFDVHPRARSRARRP